MTALSVRLPILKILPVIIILALLQSAFSPLQVPSVPSSGSPQSIQASLSSEKKPAALQEFELLTPAQGWIHFGDGLFWTMDGGDSWMDITPALPAGGAIIAISFIDTRQGWVITRPATGIGALVLQKTMDGGRTWQASTLNLPALEGQPASAVFIYWLNPDNGWLVFKQPTSMNFSAGLLFGTHDGGRSWQQLTIPLGEPVSFVSANIGWTAGGPGGGSLYRTLDGGLTWGLQAPLPEVGQEPVYSLPVFDDSQHGLLPVVAGQGDSRALQIYATMDGGVAWDLVEQLPLPLPLADPDIPRQAINSHSFVMLLPSDGSIYRFSGFQPAERIKNQDGLLAGIVQVDFADLQSGWARSVSSSCSAGKTLCTRQTRLLRTENGGTSWTALRLPLLQQDVITESFASPRQAALPGANLNALDFTGQGFDTCIPPSLSQMQSWWLNSPYGVWNVYMGGSNRGCKAANQAALTPAFISQLHQQGWKFIPTWVGMQASCSGLDVYRMSASSSVAYNQGVQEADAASDAAAALGLGSTVIYFDLESFSPADEGCKDAARAFISGWTAQLRIRGNLAALYGSPCTSYLSGYYDSAHVPDAIWAAAWLGSPGTISYELDASVWDLSCLDNTRWTSLQRIRQYAGGHDESWGATTLNIDSNVIEGMVAVPQGSGLCPSASGHLTLYAGVGCSGNSWTISTTGEHDLTSTFNDAARSLALPAGWSVRLYKDSNWTSPNVCIPASAANLENFKFSGGSSASASATYLKLFDQSNCLNRTVDEAAWVTQSAFPSVRPGESFQIYFQVRNAGTTTWQPGSYWLQNVQYPLGASPQQPVSQPVPPNGIYTWTINQVAPAYLGTYRSTWQLDHAGATFGPPMYIDVTVWDPAPGAFNKLFPSPAATGVPLNPLLTWESSPNASYYQYCVDIIDDDQCNSGWSARLSGPSAQVSNLGPSTMYYWQVRAVNRVGMAAGDLGAWNSFRTTSTLPAGASALKVYIGGSQQGSYSLSSGQSLRSTYLGVDAGPVRVYSLDGKPVVSSMRINMLSNALYSSDAEFMGIPAGRLSDTYIFTWYNNAAGGGLESQLRFANVGSGPTTVTVTIAGVLRGSYDLEPSQGMRVMYADVDDGPVEIKSTGSVPVIASLRINLKKLPAFSSYSELMGLPAGAVAGTKYMFPWYNNATAGGLQSQLRFGNVGSEPTTVRVKIGGVLQGSYDLGPSESQRVMYTNIDQGPVEVESVGGVPVIASMRVNMKSMPGYASYTEYMGQPGAAPTDTKYLFPWYNDATGGGLQTQLRFANIGSQPTTVRVKIGGVLQGSYDLGPSESRRVEYGGVNNGPVEVESDGQPVVASLRINLKKLPGYSSYTELMGLSVGWPLGLPGNQLSSTYWFPVYDNASLSSQLRFGMP